MSSQITKYLGVLLCGVGLGYALLPKKVEIKTVVVESKQSEAERNKHKETTTTEVVKPDGTKETVTKTTEDTSTQKTVTSDTRTEREKTVVYGGPPFGVRILAGTDFSVGKSIDYGVSVDKRVLGPITVGAFGFSGGVVGLSMGLQF